MLGESTVGHYLKYCVFVNGHPSSGMGNPFPAGFKQSGETVTTLLIRHVCIFRDAVCTKKVISCFHKARETVLILSDPSQKKREAFPKSRIIYSRDQKAPCPENFLLMQLCRCHSIDMSKERKLGKITWMSLIIQHD